MVGQLSLEIVDFAGSDAGNAFNSSPDSVNDPELGGTWSWPGTVGGPPGVDGGGDPSAGPNGGGELDDRLGRGPHLSGFAAKSSKFAKGSSGLSMSFSKSSPPRFPSMVVASSDNCQCAMSTPT